MAIIIPQSKPVMRRLLELMRDQQDLHIRICGHVNGCERGKDYNQKLSDARALSVYSFLKEQGIDANRMEMRGYGCTKMIYPTPKNEFENEQNRRVEIEILKVR
jgi:outer membrane protein OmpA-like peptidoglycan-associated protein